jgi:DNA-binding HxlR family transcriptional regulator
MRRKQAAVWKSTMSRSSLHGIDCSIAKSLSILGEWWTLLILRNVFHGMRTFDALQAHLEMSSSVLSTRLRQLTDAGILQRRKSGTDGRSNEYKLTERGFDLYPVLVALMQWGEKWAPNGRGPRVELIEKATGEPIAGSVVVSNDGRPLTPWDVRVVAGPGADEKIRQLVKHSAS